MDEDLAKILANGDLIIPAPRRAIILESNKRGPRYKVYLPTHYNELWRFLRSKGKDVDIIVVIRLR